MILFGVVSFRGIRSRYFQKVELPKLFPGKVHQFAVNLAIAAWGQEDKRYAAYGRFRAVTTGPRAWA